MGKNERKTYLQAIRHRYHRAGKTAILDEFCAVCGYHRKYAIRLRRYRRQPRRRVGRPGRGPVYDSPVLLTALKRALVRHGPDVLQETPCRLPLGLPGYEACQTPGAL